MENEPQDAYLPDTEDDLQPFDVREQTGNGMLKLIGSALFLLALALIVMKLFASGTRDRDQLPRILADNTPYKEVPLERGGEQTPNQDKEIYQVQNGTNTDTAVKTVPVAEEPLPKPQPSSNPASSNPVNSNSASSNPASSNPASSNSASSNPVNSKPAANVVIKEPETAQLRTAQPVTPNAKSVTPKLGTSERGQISGKYVVQVGALRSKTEAEVMWDKLAAKPGSLITAAHFSDIKRVDLGSRGIYYRLRVNGLADKEAADQLCRKLKASKQDCIVTLK